MKKSKPWYIIRVFRYLHSNAVFRKGMVFYTGSLETRFWKIGRKISLSMFSSHPKQKNIINYVTSRNMRKILTPSSLNENNASNEHNKINTLNLKEILNLVSFNWQKSKKLFSLSDYTRALKIHTNTGLLGNLTSKKPEGRPEEVEEAWGGPEAFKLITHIKDDFEQIITKHKIVLVFFHAYWCPHCLRLKKPYGRTALMAKEANLSIVFAACDVTINPDEADARGVVGIPMIKLYKDGKYFTTYRGKRTSEDLLEFLKSPSKKSASSESKTSDI